MKKQQDQAQQPKVVLKTVMRRRIKDDQLNRDYKCKCNKSYLSYPALYTHVKNKHPDELKSMIANGDIQKPPTTVQKRGRPTTIADPRLDINQAANQQYSALSVLEILTVQLVDIFKCMEEFVSQPIILVANSTNQPQELRTASEAFLNFMLPQLLRDQELPMQSIFENLAVNFAKRLCKHFASYVTARVYAILSLLVRSYREVYPKQSSEQQGVVEEPIRMDFFNDFVDQIYPEAIKKNGGVRIWENKPEIVDKLLLGFGTWMNVYGYVGKVQLKNQA